MANVLASVAAYENEVRSERIVAGQAVARANGKRWGGSKKGRRLKVTDEQLATIRRLHTEGAAKATMGLRAPDSRDRRSIRCMIVSSTIKLSGRRGCVSYVPRKAVVLRRSAAAPRSAHLGAR